MISIKFIKIPKNFPKVSQLFPQSFPRFLPVLPVKSLEFRCCANKLGTAEILLRSRTESRNVKRSWSEENLGQIHGISRAKMGFYPPRWEPPHAKLTHITWMLGLQVTKRTSSWGLTNDRGIDWRFIRLWCRFEQVHGNGCNGYRTNLIWDLV